MKHNRERVFKPNLLPYQLFLLSGVGALIWTFTECGAYTLTMWPMSIFATFLLGIAPAFGLWVRLGSRIVLDENAVTFTVLNKETRIDYASVTKLEREDFVGNRTSGNIWRIYTINTSEPFEFTRIDDYVPEQVDIIYSILSASVSSSAKLTDHTVFRRSDGREDDVNFGKMQEDAVYEQNRLSEMEDF